MNMCASPGCSDRGGGTCRLVCSSFWSALASADGSRDRKAPDSSAWNSRERDTAIWISAGGDRREDPRDEERRCGFPPSSSPPPNQSAIHARKLMRHADRGGDRRDQDVAVRDVAQLVGEHPAQLPLVEDLEDALR